MYEITPFWAGAWRYAARYELDEIADRAGGWQALAETSVGGLVALGIREKDARSWLATPPVTTRYEVRRIGDADYPERLRQVPGAPPLIYLEGDPACLDAPAVGIVGTRRCSAYGVGVARHLAGALAAAGVVVVSGLARGIDAHAHRATLSAGRTIAVVAHGLQHTAPPSNRGLRRAIVEQGGLVVSCWPDDAGAQKWTFPFRNAWISGLSDAVVVVEAPRRSGALITARHAAEQGRDVYAVPGPLRAPASVGCLDLISEGAGVVVDVEELVARLTNQGPTTREGWLEQLFVGQPLDAVARHAGLSTAELLAELARLELRGEVVRLPGQRYAPAWSAP